MAQVVNVNFRMDKDLKKSMEKTCSDMGMSMTTAFTIFAKNSHKGKNGFRSEVTADPFYCESNMEHLRRGIAALNAGKGVEHECIEVEDE